jgi:hypothetical protein
MTRALVVYESVFGNAGAIAVAIADGLSSSMPVDVVRAAEAPAEISGEVGLLVVGGPNHAFGMPRPSTRASAVTQHGAAPSAAGPGLREWLAAARPARPGLPAAAYDTRSGGHPLLTRLDHAARTEETLLGRLGATVVAPAEHFVVVDTAGPLAEGEQERARAWGRTLAALVAERSGSR